MTLDRLWTDQEEQIVRSGVEYGKSPSEVAALLQGRSRSSVRHKMARMSVPYSRKEQVADFRGSAVLAEKEKLLAELRKLPRQGSTHPRTTKESCLLEVACFDLHFGKLAWQAETGEAYDLKIAQQVFKDAVEDLIAKTKGYRIEQCLFPVGNDLLQVDNLVNTTTSGTPQDTDSRYAKAFRHAVESMTWAIRRLRQIAPVSVPVIPGNHDRLAAFHVGEVLEAIFADDPMVTVDNAPTPRKYVKYGTVLIGYAHGSEEKQADLPLIMARERPQEWASCTIHEWHIGHNHKKKQTRYTASDTLHGVGVSIISSLTAADAWHTQQGYIKSRRMAEAFVWHKRDGYMGHFASKPIGA